MKKAALTFDLDLTDYIGGGEVDEMEIAFPKFQLFCKENAWMKSTWFIRIDDQILHRYGRADYIFVKHREKLEWLQHNGHELGWHFHSYVQKANRWVQNADDEAIINELDRNYVLAKNYNLKLMRMGWTYHSNATMMAINKYDLVADCSAMPRPNYTWDHALRNWEITQQQPYYPSVKDYRTTGNKNHNLLEFPISTMQIETAYDTEKGVIRYINPCYKNEIFEKAITEFSGDICNLIAHPYEFLDNENAHGLLAFDFNVFKNNMIYLHNRGIKICTIGELVNDFLSNK